MVNQNFINLWTWIYFWKHGELFWKGKASIRNCPVFAFAICTLSNHFFFFCKMASGVVSHHTRNTTCHARAMQHRWDYPSRRPVGSPRAASGAAGTPSLGRPQHRLRSSWMLLLSVHLLAQVALFPYEAWFTDTFSCHITLRWQRASGVAVT